ncbi:hypothetical protein B0H21DRAFT_686367 [Amylocystis lapponica]|nr:hypothetical protein B0H21DRAFT_686367 [Amylocystis lapponica]
MALTATAQSALHREPVWDEVIVPTLRKRLKDESTILAKRISAASMGDGDEPDLYPSSPYVRQEAAIGTQYSHFQRPSAIPRPSLQQQSKSTMESYEVYSMPAQPVVQRTRTLSQPPLMDFSTPRDSSAAYMQSNRPISPLVSGKGTRIPTSRGRAGSTSQASANGSAASHGASSKPNGEINPDLLPVHETQHSYASRSSVRVLRRPASELFNEQPPFGPNSSTSLHHDFDSAVDRRMSSDSEEHPFEHWYRGDVSRNGGVGELRVGRREEMLDIANYGHTFRRTPSQMQMSSYSRSRSSSRARDVGSVLGARKRAGSVGQMLRESFYLDEDDTVHSTRMVLDEPPPTDFENDSEWYEDHGDSHGEQDVMPHPNGTVSSPSLLTGALSPNNTTSRHRAAQSGASRIPTPASLRQTSTHAQTPPKPTRAASESASSSIAGRSPTAQRVQTQPQDQLTPPTAKRRAKSPAAASASATKKTRQSRPPSSMPKSARKEENRRSIGQYPDPDGDDIVDAIPTWTQPIPSSGNWDDVVLPVVARKKGLNGHYEKADGSPRPKQQNEAPYEPAPGTFGYDHSKYRPPRSGMQPEQISMDEFGQKATRPEVAEEAIVINQQPSPNKMMVSEYDRIRVPSPAPFSHYGHSPPISNDRVATELAKVPPHMTEAKDVQSGEDGGAGCCKCVIM